MILDTIRVKNNMDYQELLKKLPREYINKSCVTLMEDYFDSRVKSVIIEYPYVDKDYRSTYYGFYSKRHRTHSKLCVRLHFFSTEVKKSEVFGDESKNEYLGSMVLRPTEVTPIGRTLISPKIIKNFSGYICEANFENNFMGLPLKVSCFPHISQDTDVTVCAHAVCWMVSRYYSQKYEVYPERLAFDIVELSKNMMYGRMIPSRGLTLGQISEILSSIGFYPEIILKELYKEKSEFYNYLYSYVESGIPVVAALKDIKHAVAIIGHGEPRNTNNLFRKNKNLIDLGTKRFISASELMGSIIVNDDNVLPYKEVSWRRKKKDRDYSIRDIDGFVVPLYEKMYLNAEDVYTQLIALLKSPLFNIKGNYILRVFMTSSRSYKKELRESINTPGELISMQLEIPMPKFIWLAEIAKPDDYSRRLTSFRWVFDATCNPFEENGFILVHDNKEALINDRIQNNIHQISFKLSLNSFPIYVNNLKQY